MTYPFDGCNCLIARFPVEPSHFGDVWYGINSADLIPQSGLLKIGSFGPGCFPSISWPMFLNIFWMFHQNDIPPLIKIVKELQKKEK